MILCVVKTKPLVALADAQLPAVVRKSAVVFPTIVNYRQLQASTAVLSHLHHDVQMPHPAAATLAHALLSSDNISATKSLISLLVGLPS